MSEKNIIGRKREIQLLNEVLQSREAEFVALYGRRRVGKTHLISNFFSDKSVYFEITGQKDGNLYEQLENFISAFGEKFYGKLPLRTPKSWKEAFTLMDKVIKNSDKSKKFVFFIDELPWLASRKSNLMQVLDHFWNTSWSRLSNFILVVCGSAASWMLDKLVNAKGGLYNRLTRTILLKPYDLKGVQDFLEHRGVKLKPMQVLDLYMVFGGIPHYLMRVTRGKSATQIIDEVCFQKEGLLYGEYERLFHSLFDQAEAHKAIVKAISAQKNGISRDQLIKETGLSSGGGLQKYIEELEASEIIKTYVPLGKKRKDRYFRIADEYVSFYLRWIEPIKERGIEGLKSYWKTQSKTPKADSWKGYTFENICLKHVEQIRKALDLEHIHCEIGGWRYLPKKKSNELGAQIDLVFDREDGSITLCEIKYSEKKYQIDKKYSRELVNKINVFEKHYPTEKQTFLAMITTHGVKQNIWSEDLMQNEVVLDDLFEKKNS